MPLYLDTTTNVVVDLPENVGTHSVLGAHLVPYQADSEPEPEPFRYNLTQPEQEAE